MKKSSAYSPISISKICLTRHMSLYLRWRSSSSERERQKDMQTYIHTYIQYIHTCTMYIHTYIHTYIQTVKKTQIQRDRQRQTDTQTFIQREQILTTLSVSTSRCHVSYFLIDRCIHANSNRTCMQGRRHVFRYRVPDTDASSFPQGTLLRGQGMNTDDVEIIVYF